MNIGEKINKIRKMAGMTQAELAEKIHVSRQTIAKWEKGISSPDLECAVAFCELFQISLDEFIKGEQADRTNKSEDKISLGDMIKINRRTQRMTLLLLVGLFFLVIGILAALFTTALSNSVDSIEYMLYRYIVTGQYAYAPVNYKSLFIPAASLIGIGIVLCAAYIFTYVYENRKETKSHESDHKRA